MTALGFLSTNHASSTERSPLAAGELDLELNERVCGAASVVVESGIIAAVAILLTRSHTEDLGNSLIVGRKRRGGRHFGRRDARFIVDNLEASI